MFASLRHWFDSLKQESRLFEHPDDELLHVALASVLYHLIRADHEFDARERGEFDRILVQEFILDREQLNHLYQAAKASTSDLQADLHTINFYLKKNPAVRMHFMEKLLGLIDLHGVKDRELELFYATLHKVFPEIGQAREDDGP